LQFAHGGDMPAEIGAVVTRVEDVSAVPAAGHNRWHPVIAPVREVRPGERITVSTRDGLDGQITNESKVRDLAQLDLRRAHPLSGPIRVVGAEPGDLLEVEILTVETAEFGSTLVLPGVGLLGELIDEPLVVKWHLDVNSATSVELPGIRIPGAPFIGVMGVAPSEEAVRAFRARESVLAEAGVALPPSDPNGAVPSAGRASTEGLRTIPPRENGGNMDIKQLRAGSKLTVRVLVPGALFSLGDIHFAQGDGESCGFAIETSGRVTLRFGLRKAATAKWQPLFPTFECPAHVEVPAADARCFVTTGIPITTEGELRDLDVRLAAANALREMMNYLQIERGYSTAQAYAICSVGVDLRISSIVNIPSAVVSAILSLEIFDEH
jgi:formamidase